MSRDVISYERFRRSFDRAQRQYDNQTPLEDFVDAQDAQEREEVLADLKMI